MPESILGGGVKIVAGRPTLFGQLRLQERKQVAMRRVDGPETKKSQETGQGTPWTVDGNPVVNMAKIQKSRGLSENSKISWT